MLAANLNSDSLISELARVSYYGHCAGHLLGVGKPLCFESWTKYEFVGKPCCNIVIDKAAELYLNVKLANH